MDAAVRARRRAHYETWSTPAIFLAGMLFLAGFVQVVTTGGDTTSGRTLMALSWFVFAVDLVITWVLDDDPRTFPRRRWLGILAVLVPLFRVLLVVYVFVRLARGRERLQRKIQLYTLYLTILVVTFGAVLVLAAERTYPGSNIHTYGQAVWWAAVTVTTVGFGDYVPVSPAGRLLATVMLVNGVAIISIFTATISSRFVSDSGRGRSPVSLDEIDERLARIEAAIAALAAAQDRPAEAPTTPAMGAEEQP